MDHYRAHHLHIGLLVCELNARSWFRVEDWSIGMFGKLEMRLRDKRRSVTYNGRDTIIGPLTQFEVTIPGPTLKTMTPERFLEYVQTEIAIQNVLEQPHE